MPPTRSVRARAVNNENDENAPPMRVTRAKAAAPGGHDELSEGMVKKALQSRKNGTSTVSGAAAQRKRGALGDISNMTKNEPTEGKGGKKATNTTRAALVTKTSNAGVQKVSRTNSRTALVPKDSNTKKTIVEPKRPVSGSGAPVERTNKKRSTGSSAKEEPTPASENEKPTSKLSVKVEESTQVGKKEVIEVQEISPDAVILPEDMEDVIPDLDADDLEDPLMVAEYAAEIFDYLRDIEVSTMPNPDYMDHQDHVEWNDRDILNDWLVQVHQRFQLLPETFYLAINIIDRFLSNKIVQLDKLQLVGITAMFIASKYEEVISPHVSNFTYMAKDYTDQEILSAERFILAALNYDLSYPNPMNFLRRISKADNYDIQTRTLGKYLLEISTLDHRFLEFCPSHIAAAAMYMSRLILERGEWDATIAHYAGYTEEEIMPVFKLMVDYCNGKVKHEAFHSKYASKKYLKASLLVRQWVERYLERSKRRHELFARDIKSR